MKSKIVYSRFVIVLTTIVSVTLFAGCIASLRLEAVFFTLLAVFLLLYISALFYAPAYIKADKDYIIMGSLLKKHRILMRNVGSVELFQPTMGAIRIFASGGYMGYWGIFREGDIGRYCGFYGKASDCFLVRMKNGDKYVLGCKNPSAMVDYIKFRMQK